jgi:hypothetical protein
MKLKLLPLSFALTFAAPVFAGMSDAQLAQGMRADMAKYMITLKTPRLIFLWADASDIVPQGQYKNSFPATFSSFKEYVDKQGSKIFRARSTSDADIEGPGLYLAGSPTSTRHYGGQKSFGLIVGLIRPGSKIFNGDATSSISANLQAELQARGCSVYHYSELLDSAGDTKCTKVKQILVGQDISFADARMYNYSNADLIEGCSHRNPYKDIAAPASKIRDYEGLDTFVAYSSRLFSDVMGITNKTTVSNHTLSNQILSYLKGIQSLGLNSAYGGVLSSPEQLKDPAIKAMGRSEIQKFSQKYILGCNL